MRFGSLLSRQSGCLVLDWRDDWWRKCNRHRLHEAACLARGAPTRLGTWMRQAVPLCALCCTLHAACCMVYGAVVSVPDVEPWGCWRLTVSLIGRFLLYAAFWQMTNHNERLSYTFNWHLPSLPLPVSVSTALSLANHKTALHCGGAASYYPVALPMSMDERSGKRGLTTLWKCLWIWDKH